MVTDKY